MKKFLRKMLLLFALISSLSLAAQQKIHVLVWSEGTEPKNVYPRGINGAIAKSLKKQHDMQVMTANLNDSDYGISKKTLDHTDVLIWFAHEKHDDIPDEVAQRIVRQVKDHGMGFIALHSAHFSKPFKMLLESSGAWSDYQENGKPELIKIVAPQHPIAKGLHSFTIPKTEMFVEPFDVPTPDTVVIKGIWDNKYTSREVMTWQLGKGKLVYIRAGHESYPIYFMPEMRKIIINSVRWAVKKCRKI